VAVPVLGVTAQALRLRDRQTRPEQRAVARLLCAALLPSLVVALLWLGARAGTAAGVGGAVAFSVGVQQLFPAVFAIVPVVLVAGVLRYRLWDIDRLLSRVLLYGAVVLGVGVGYVVAVTAAAALVGTGLWSTVLALAAAAALVEPLRAAARRWANRVVFGQDLSPAEAMRTLVSGLEQLHAGGEIDQLAAVALAATRADRAAVWLGQGDRAVRLAHAGPSRGEGGRVRDTDWPIGYQGRPLGVLRLGVDDSRRLSATDRATAARIAAHAGLVLHNAQLTVRLVDRVAELSTRSEALRSARRRLVTAQDAERHRLERDLHDGAQQALVAVVIGVAALRPPVPRAEYDELVDVLRIARRDLDAVFASPRPAALAAGLSKALAVAATLAERSGVSVELEVTESPVPPEQEIEVAVYYCCLEALQNVVKHAGARRVRVEVAFGPEVRFTVQDDGRGIDPDTVADSAGGLLQLGARLAVLGGALTVQNGPGGGVLVRGSVPTRAGAHGVGVAR
jgi:signal transduction histidine kinase